MSSDLVDGWTPLEQSALRAVAPTRSMAGAKPEPGISVLDSAPACISSTPSNDSALGTQHSALTREVLMASRWDTLSANGTAMRCYVSAPDGTGPFPAVIVIQHAGGVDEFVRGMSDRLA